MTPTTTTTTPKRRVPALLLICLLAFAVGLILQFVPMKLGLVIVGLAIWCAYRLGRSRTGGMGSELAAFLRGNRTGYRNGLSESVALLRDAQRDRMAISGAEPPEVTRAACEALHGVASVLAGKVSR